MSNWIDYKLEVLASSPTEMEQIAERLNEPSPRLIAWVAQKESAWHKVCQLASEDRYRLIEQLGAEAAKEFANNPPAISAHVDIAELRTLVAFEKVDRCHHASDRAWIFHNTFERWIGIVNSHLNEISEEFPSAIFLLEYCDMQASYSGKSVIRAGELIREVFDGNQQAQAVDWVLPDIFAPFKAEYERRDYPLEYGGPVEFGSLWNKWVDDLIATAQSLKELADGCGCDPAMD